MFHDGDNPLRQIGTGYSGGIITNSVWRKQTDFMSLLPAQKMDEFEFDSHRGMQYQKTTP